MNTFFWTAHISFKNHLKFAKPSIQYSWIYNFCHWNGIAPFNYITIAARCRLQTPYRFLHLCNVSWITIHAVSYQCIIDERSPTEIFWMNLDNLTLYIDTIPIPAIHFVIWWLTWQEMKGNKYLHQKCYHQWLWHLSHKYDHWLMNLILYIPLSSTVF